MSQKSNGPDPAKDEAAQQSQAERGNPFGSIIAARKAAENGHRTPAPVPTSMTGYQWMAWAREQEVEPASARHLLLLLASYVNEHGVCWPGMEKTLEPKMGLSARRIRQLTEALCRAGVLHVEHTPRKKNGRRGVNRYTLLNRGKHTTAGHRLPGEAGDTPPGEAHHRFRRSPASHELPEERTPNLNRQLPRASADGRGPAGENGEAPPRSSASADADGQGTSTPNTRTPTERRGKHTTAGHELPPDGEAAAVTQRVMALASRSAQLQEMLDYARSQGWKDDTELADHTLTLVAKGDLSITDDMKVRDELTKLAKGPHLRLVA